jgi:hypothetical protein
MRVGIDTVRRDVRRAAFGGSAVEAVLSGKKIRAEFLREKKKPLGNHARRA